jgi:hypothetical protein
MEESGHTLEISRQSQQQRHAASVELAGCIAPRRYQNNRLRCVTSGRRQHRIHILPCSLLPGRYVFVSLTRRAQASGLEDFGNLIGHPESKR